MNTRLIGDGIVVAAIVGALVSGKCSKSLPTLDIHELKALPQVGSKRKVKRQVENAPLST